MGTETVNSRSHIKVALGIPTVDFTSHQQVLVEILALGLPGGSPSVVEKIGCHLGDREGVSQPGGLRSVFLVVSPKYWETAKGVAQLFWLPANQTVNIQGMNIRQLRSGRQGLVIDSSAGATWIECFHESFHPIQGVV
jgi:hypothetical protein